MPYRRLCVDQEQPLRLSNERPDTARKQSVTLEVVQRHERLAPESGVEFVTPISGTLSCRLDWNTVVLRISDVRSIVRQPHTLVGSHSRLPCLRFAGHGAARCQLYRVVVRSTAGVAVPDAQSPVRHRFKPRLHGVVADHRRSLPQGPQVPRARHQYPALRISSRYVYLGIQSHCCCLFSYVISIIGSQVVTVHFRLPKHYYKGHLIQLR